MLTFVVNDAEHKRGGHGCLHDEVLVREHLIVLHDLHHEIPHLVMHYDVEWTGRPGRLWVLQEGDLEAELVADRY